MNKTKEKYVKVFGLNSEGCVLMLRRGENARSDIGLFDLPGGKVETGEGAREALQRETLEETGLTLKIKNQLLEKILKHPHKNLEITVVWYIGELESKDPELNSENTEYKWTKPDKIMPLLKGTMLNVHQEAVKKFIESRLWK